MWLIVKLFLLLYTSVKNKLVPRPRLWTRSCTALMSNTRGNYSQSKRGWKNMVSSRARPTHFWTWQTRKLVKVSFPLVNFFCWFFFLLDSDVKGKPLKGCIVPAIVVESDILRSISWFPPLFVQLDEDNEWFCQAITVVRPNSDSKCTFCSPLPTW